MIFNSKSTLLFECLFVLHINRWGSNPERARAVKKTIDNCFQIRSLQKKMSKFTSFFLYEKKLLTSRLVHVNIKSQK